MLILKKISQFGQYVSKMTRQMVRYIGEAALRIFGPDKDEYPPTGVQPFEGEPADKKDQKSW